MDLQSIVQSFISNGVIPSDVINCGGSVNIPLHEVISFVFFLFVIWFLARFVRFIFVRFQSLLGLNKKGD